MNSFLSRILNAPQPLTPREASALTALLNGPLAKRALHEIDIDQTEKRRANACSLAELPGIHAATIKESELACEAAARLAERIETDLQAARTALQSARSAATSAQMAYAGRRHALEQELIGMADPRLATFIDMLELISGTDLVFKLNYWSSAETTKDIWGNSFMRPVLASNSAEISTARAALLDVGKLARAMRLSAVDYADVSRALVAWCESLIGPLSALELNPPSLSADQSEVGVPFRWVGQPKVLARQSESVSATPTAANLHDRRKDLNRTGAVQ